MPWSMISAQRNQPWLRGVCKGEGQGSNDDQMKRGPIDHDAGASNEGRCP
jgi:hypothetical protein